MKIGIIGASGKAGSFILREAVERGHEVTALVRNPVKIESKNVNVVKKDVFDLTVDDIRPYDVIVNAFKDNPGKEHQHVEAGRTIIEALKGTPYTRLIVVGGAGSLYVNEEKTTRVMNTPTFPAAILPTAQNMGKNLEELQNSNSINWTYISPSAILDPDGKRTGSYRSGDDNFLVNNSGKSYISYSDYAIAVVDEIEKAQYVNKRFTVVSESE